MLVQGDIDELPVVLHLFDLNEIKNLTLIGGLDIRSQTNLMKSY